MSTAESIELVPNEISIIDYYDGAMRGVVESDGKYYLFIMVAFDPAKRRRAYVVINLDPVTAREIKQLCWKPGDLPTEDDEEKWHRLEEIYDEYLTNYKGPVYFSTEEPSKEQSVAITAIAFDHLDQLRKFDIEKTIDAEAQELWFS